MATFVLPSRKNVDIGTKPATLYMQRVPLSLISFILIYTNHDIIIEFQPRKTIDIPTYNDNYTVLNYQSLVL